MEIDIFREPRTFPVGLQDLKLRHVANIGLMADEMVTFTSEGGREYDVTAKVWGYYATPSIGGRLLMFGMRTALMRNIDTRQLYVVLVLQDRIALWNEYMRAEHQELVIWLDEVEDLLERGALT